MEGAVAVRPVRRSDAADWERLRQRLWPAPPHEHAREIGSFFDSGGRAPSDTFLAFDQEGKAVGFAEASIRSYAEGCRSDRVAYLEGLFVEERHRGHGVASALVGAVEEWGRSQGCREMASDTEIGNQASAMMHRALGFEEVERIICFRKDLQDPNRSTSPAEGCRRLH